MLTASPITRQTVGKTFSVAISTLGVGAVLQLAVIGWAFATRPANPLPELAVNEAPTIAHADKAPTVAPNFGSDPFPQPPDVVQTTSNSAEPIRPTPVPAREKPPEPLNRFEETMLQAKQLRDQGDMGAAIIKYREAGAMDPKNAAPIAELAMTYEKMGNADRAAEQWKRIIEMGPNLAGVYFNLADAKSKVAQERTSRNATQAMGDAPVDTTAATPDIAAGAMLGLGTLEIKDQSEDAAAKHFTLHIPIKARPKAKMDVKDLVIHVLLYDIVDGQNVVQTSADVNTRWMSPPADWTEGDTEELVVEYQLPKAEAKAAKRENRKYFGYIVRIYYKQQLQAAVAEPSRLAVQYPPPPTLPKDTEK